jgi:hypothetical protein
MKRDRIAAIALGCMFLGVVGASAQTGASMPAITATQRPASDYSTAWTIRNQKINGDGTFQFDIYCANIGSATDFKIGDVTLRIKFNPAALAHPRSLCRYDRGVEKEVAYTDWRVVTVGGPIMWPVYTDSGVIRFVEPESGVVGIDTNLVSGGAYSYARMGYTDALRALLPSDPASLHNRVQFDIVDVKKPFGIEWDTPLGTKQSITRKRMDGTGQAITAYAVFDVAAMATPAETPTGAPTPTSTPAVKPALVIDPVVLKGGQPFMVGVGLLEKISRQFDFYLLAGSPGGVYTICLDGSLKKGVTPLYRNVRGCPSAYYKTVWGRVRVPASMKGKTVIFYAAVMEAGKMLSVSRLTDLGAGSPNVIAFDKRPVTVD